MRSRLGHHELLEHLVVSLLLNLQTLGEHNCVRLVLLRLHHSLERLRVEVEVRLSHQHRLGEVVPLRYLNTIQLHGLG